MPRKHIKPIKNWRRIWWRLWSVRLILLAALMDGAYTALDVFSNIVPPKWYLFLSMTLSVGAVIARILQQPGIHGKESD